MPPALVEAVTPFVTVYNGRSQFDPEAGPLPLKALTLGIDGAGLAISVAPSRRRVFSVRATAALPNGVCSSGRRHYAFRATRVSRSRGSAGGRAGDGGLGCRSVYRMESPPW
jgi:hypothetical protein